MHEEITLKEIKKAILAPVGEKDYEVAKFWWPRHDTGEYKDGDVLCYLKYRSPDSGGNQMIYTVRAKTGREAKAKAKILRQIDGP